MSDPAREAVLRQRLEELRELRASGVRSARFGEDETEFRTDAELASAIADLERQLANLAGRSTIQFVNFRNNRGY